MTSWRLVVQNAPVRGRVMAKLAERERAPRQSPVAAAPALAVQFFLIPLAVVGVLVLIYTGFRMMIEDQRTAQDYLEDIRYGGRERRWPAAYELSRLMASDGVEAENPGLGQALVEAFSASSNDDPRVRRYLALAIGRLHTPPPGTVETLLEAARSSDVDVAISVIWALGSLGDPAAVPGLIELYGSSDPGIRKVTVYALGALDGTAQIRTLRAALDDSAPDVQWNAAVALAQHGDTSSIVVLRRMLDRDYVERLVTRTASSDDQIDPVSDVMITGLQAVGQLGDPSLRDSVAALSRDDSNLRVRQAALEALEQLERGTPHG